MPPLYPIQRIYHQAPPRHHFCQFPMDNHHRNLKAQMTQEMRRRYVLHQRKWTVLYVFGLGQLTRSQDNRPGQFQRILFSALVDPRGCPKTKRFFPNTVFTELISEMLVLRELQHCFEYLDPVEMRRLTRIICGAGSFKKIFALLALVDKVSDIRCFIEQNVADIDLPLRKIALPASNIFTLGCHVDPENYTQPVECLNNWNPATIRMFEEWQWSTLAPTFQRGETKDIKHIALPDDMPLPFTADSQYEKDSKMIQGGYSTVSKVVIHPAHHYFNDSEVSRHPISPHCCFKIYAAYNFFFFFLLREPNHAAEFD